MIEFYQKLAKYHASEKKALQEENAFLWSRLVSLIDIVITHSYGDGSGENYMRSEAESALKELIERFDEQ